MWRWIHSGGAFEALSIWFGAAFTIAVCIALGALSFGRTLKQWPERFVIGAALLNLGVFVICCLHLAYPPIIAVSGAIILYLWLRSRPFGPAKMYIPNYLLSNYLLTVAFTVYFILYFFNALAPETSPDGYHLSLVARYLHEHTFHPITWNMYASFSEGIEMLFLFAFAFGKHSAAGMVHFAFFGRLSHPNGGLRYAVGVPTIGCVRRLAGIRSTSGRQGRDECL